jgi:hypothetical protein
MPQAATGGAAANQSGFDLNGDAERVVDLDAEVADEGGYRS